MDPTLDEVEEEDESLDFIDYLPTAQTTDESEVVTIDLDRLEELMAEEIDSEGSLDASDMADREEIAEDIAGLTEDDEELYEIDESPLHDPCVIAYLIDPSLFKGRFVNVEVEKESNRLYLSSSNSATITTGITDKLFPCVSFLKF